MSLKSLSISVSWASYVPDLPYILEFYAVVCTPTSQDAGPIVALANETAQTYLEVLRLRPQNEYSVQVLAVTFHTESGSISFKGSHILNVSTLEGGKYSGHKILPLSAFIIVIIFSLENTSSVSPLSTKGTLK